MPLTQEKIYTEADYYNIPEHIHAELINGQIYYQAAPSRIHQEIVMFLSNKIANYIHAHHGSCKIYPAPFAVRLFQDQTTIVEPDISVICDRNKLTDKGCDGAPDWIIEVVSPSTANHDYIWKLQLYAKAGVKEYWIIDPIKKSIFVYQIRRNNI